MKVIDATFGQAVRTPNNKQETFVSSTHYSLEWTGDYLKVKSSTNDKVVIVFPTNISHMTIEDKKESKSK